MIKPYELRVGNLLSWNPKLSHPKTTLPPTQIKVTAIFQNKIGYISPEIEHRVEPFEDDQLQLETPNRALEELEPILLNTEFLRNCGFEKIADNTYCKGEFKLQMLQESNRAVFQLNGFEIKPKIKYLHQLQNLYFILTGEELDICLYN